MLTRYRWYRIQFPRSNVDLNGILASRPLTQNASFGFLRVEGVIGSPKFRFLWRTKIVVTRLDDEGTPSYEEVASVSFTDFVIIVVGGVTFLRIENPGRNIRDLLNALESIVGFGFTSKPLTFDKVKPTSVFEHVEVTKLVGLKVIGAVIDEDLVARMEFASKQGMIVENMKLLDGLRYKVDCAVFELIYEGIRGQVTFASSGVVKISGQLAPRLVHLIEQDLPKLV
ncbi:hypothetical protein [Pseudogulbenkiania ferrooxidans]|uniref:Uncharacterized protein n=1 Tax=Pseudogulbenkiania ferrooxidans 2002 TaxID=279714 RepID=B9Z8V4_9NEIS|nr:hypothetical protein [Pseudogulbenkiania ferrooxidans]EEG06773.1 hypothetical protein FuraDRAFT_3791 [Pseudogulbenkiania ferrooxidans 2002]